MLKTNNIYKKKHIYKKKFFSNISIYNLFYYTNLYIIYFITLIKNKHVQYIISLLKKWKKKIEDFSIQNPNLFSQTQTERQSTILSQSETNPQSTNTVQESNTMQNQTQNHQVAQPSLAQKVRHEWFQNENFVTISVFIKKVDPKNVTLEFEERSLSLSVKLSSGSEFCFDLDVLAHEIVPEESKYSVLSTKIEIKLKKKVVGIKWSVLEGEDDGIPDHINTLNQSDKPCYPSSSKKKFDWDSLEKSIEDEKPEGEAALNHLFQQIYRDADDNTRRAMMKSYVESNGTCLSTNWDEVKKSKVECKPPEGMIAKPYSE